MNLNPFKAAGVALDKAGKAGASYVDFRLISSQSESLSYGSGAPEDVAVSTEQGFGIRVLVNGAWGFCSSADLNESEIARIAEKSG